MFELLDSKSAELSLVGQLLDVLDDNEIQISSYGRTRFQIIHEQNNPTPVVEKNNNNDAGDNMEITEGAVLYVERVTINQEFKGLGLGLFLVDMADSILNDHMSLCLLMPYPLQYLKHEMDSKSPQFTIDQDKIKKYWMRLGFDVIIKDDLDFLERWNGYGLPSIKSICSHLFA